MDSFRHIEIIHALAAHGSFNRAADAIGISQPVLSRTLAHVEKELGVKLFDRGPQGATPTIFGRIIIDRCGPALQNVADALHEIRQVQGLESGNLMVSAGAFPAEISVQTALGRLLSKYPDLKVTYSTVMWAQARKDVLEGRADIAVGDISDLLPAGHPDLDIEPIAPRSVRFCCRFGHPLAARDEVSLADIFSFPFASMAMTRKVGPLLPNDVSKAGAIDPETGYFVPRLTVNTLRSALAIVQESDAVTFVHPSYIASEIAQKRLHLLPVAFDWMKVHYGFMQLKGRSLSPAASEFKKLVLEIEAGIK
ncbi:MAG: LysR family transcriptional regulator [Beijerinckiaceae bacterium]